jgi:hypothetical protein
LAHRVVERNDIVGDFKDNMRKMDAKVGATCKLNPVDP